MKSAAYPLGNPATASPQEIAHLDICGAVSCDIYDPKFPPCICLLPAGHDGMHREPGVCRWKEAEASV